MGAFFQGIHRRFIYRNSADYLATVWIIGLSLGVLAGCEASTPDRSWLLAVFETTPSFPGLFLAVFFPLLVSFLIAGSFHPFLFYAFVFCKGVCYGFTGVYPGFSGDFSWPVRFLLLFSDSLMLPVHWMWWRFLLRCRENRSLGFLFVSALALLIVSFDYSVISPFFLRTIILEG